MIEVMRSQDAYLADFERSANHRPPGQPSWLHSMRRSAIDRFAELGFPTLRDEEWRHTNIAPIAEAGFTLAKGPYGRSTAGQLRDAIGWETEGPRLVFLDGRFAAHLSSMGRMPEGVRIDSLATALKEDAQVLQAHLTQHARYQDHAFVALNTAFLEDGAFVHLPKGTRVAEPIHLIFVSTTADRAAVSHPRTLIVAERQSQATIVETYAALDGGVYFTNAVTEIVAGEDAVIDHYKLQCEGDRAYHIGTLQIHQYRSSNVSSHAISLGAALARNEINAVLDGEGCECTLNGLYVLGGSQRLDNHLRVEHAMPHCNSREYFKGLLDGRSRGAFTGRIIVRQDAQETDAKQTNMNLLLSDEALVDSMPQLEIFADDVKCTHGATIGQIDEEAIFYLRSRGIGETAARGMLIYAFAAESLSQIRVAPLQARLRQLLLVRLPQGELPREAV